MIIQIRGTSGSGKTYAMRAIMEDLYRQYGPAKSKMVEGRKKPVAYQFGPVVVLGHYEAICGGCDNVGSAAKVYDLTTEIVREQPRVHVLGEGLLLSEDSKWAKQLKADGHEVACVFLTTPLAKCIEQVCSRRREAGNDKPLNTENTSRRVAVIERARVKLVDCGISCRRCPAGQAPRVVYELLRLHAQREGE